MIKFIGKLFSGIVRTILLVVLLIAGLVGAAYYWYVSHQLDKALRAAGVKEGYTTSYQWVGRSQARIETGYPFTVRVFVKETQAHNWIPTEGHGLVRSILQWSPDQRKWVEEPHETLPSDQRLKLEAMIRNPSNGGLIEALQDESLVVREVAFRELKMRTGQDFGYRPDATAEERQASVAQWGKWWEENKVKWGAEKVLDTVKDLLNK